MEQNYTDDQLDSMLGTGSKQFTKFRTISVDNGIDTMGTGATGNFVEKQYNPDTKETTRIPFADIFDGVILAAKAQVADKSKFPSWRTSEFDPTNVNELLTIFPLQGGKFIKEANGDIKKFRMTYRELKAQKSTPQPDGSSQSTFNYFIVLYVGVLGEVIKLKFKGSSRGNWFDYSKSVAQLGAQIYNVNTVFSTYMDKAVGKYAIKFMTEKDDRGNLVPVDAEEVKKMRIIIFKSMQPYAKPTLAAPQQRPQIASVSESPQEKEAPTEKAAMSADIRWEDMGKEEEEVPFSGSIE